jgi:hypothetical protein
VPFINKFFVVYFNVSIYKYDDETMVKLYRNALTLFAELPNKLSGKTILKAHLKDIQQEIHALLRSNKIFEEYEH